MPPSIPSFAAEHSRSPRRIAVIRALHLGDMLCAIPAIRAIRWGFPHARITLISLPWARELLPRFPFYFHDFMEFPGYPGIPERPYSASRARDFFDRARSRSFDLAIQMHGDGRIMNDFVAQVGAKSVAGFRPAGTLLPPSGYFMPYPERDAEVVRLLRLVDFLGLRRCGTELEFPVQMGDVAEVLALLGPATEEPGYVCIHPGSGSPERRWTPAGFASVADVLAAHGYSVVLTGGPRERRIVEQVRARMRHEAIDLAGRTSLGGLAALLQGARLLVANDTGVSHLAAAVGTPSVVVFTGSDPARWAPLDASLHRAVGAGRSDAAADTAGAPRARVAPADVIEGALELLGASR